jgi:hypothetical protein
MDWALQGLFVSQALFPDYSTHNPKQPPESPLTCETPRGVTSGGESGVETIYESAPQCKKHIYTMRTRKVLSIRAKKCC